MYEISDDLKLLLFNKVPAEPLTEEELVTWRECVESELAKDVTISLEDPVFALALEIYLRLQADNIAPWENFERSVLRNGIDSR